MLFEAFKRNRAELADKASFLIAAGDRSVPITWRQFARDVETVAYLVETRAPRAKIGILGENSYEWMVAHAACLFAGAVAVPLEVTLAPEEIAERLRFVGATVLVHSSLYLERARAVGKLMPSLFVAGFGSKNTDRVMAAARAKFEAESTSVFDRPPRDENETAMILFTSGTTSKPRGAELTIAGISAFAAFAGAQLAMKPGDRSLMLLPLFHVYGICASYAMLVHGVAQGVCPDFRRIYDAVERFRANYCFLVPALADVLAAKIEQRGATAAQALGTPIDWVLVGGAPLSSATRERLQRLGVLALTAYGLTETTALYSIAPLASPHPGSAGRVCTAFGVETRVSDRGELLIRGPNVLKRYFGEPDRTAEVLSSDGWFRTGDLGQIDAQGFVHITGRASRTIVLSSGKKVAPEELEEKLLSIPGVKEVVVSGDGASREVRAEIFADLSEAAIRRRVADLNCLLPVHKRIRTVSVRNEPFPRTPSGKIAVAAAAAAVPPPAAPGEPTALLRMFRLVGACAFAALGVLLLNVLPQTLERLGVAFSGPAEIVWEFVEEFGEIALALFAIAAYFLSGRILRRRKAPDRARKGQP